jgi:hypothetical protein
LLQNVTELLQKYYRLLRWCLISAAKDIDTGERIESTESDNHKPVGEMESAEDVPPCDLLNDSLFAM